jgi:hypothetical protein
LDEQQADAFQEDVEFVVAFQVVEAFEQHQAVFEGHQFGVVLCAQCEVDGEVDEAFVEADEVSQHSLLEVYAAFVLQFLLPLFRLLRMTFFRLSEHLFYRTAVHLVHQLSYLLVAP